MYLVHVSEWDMPKYEIQKGLVKPNPKAQVQTKPKTQDHRALFGAYTCLNGMRQGMKWTQSRLKETQQHK